MSTNEIINEMLDIAFYGLYTQSELMDIAFQLGADESEIEFIADEIN